MSKRPHTNYDKTDAEIEELVKTQMAAGSQGEALPTPGNPKKQLEEYVFQYAKKVLVAAQKGQLPTTTDRALLEAQTHSLYVEWFKELVGEDEPMPEVLGLMVEAVSRNHIRHQIRKKLEE